MNGGIQRINIRPMMTNRPGRLLAVLVAVATMVAGCQCAAPPPAASAMRPFVGSWYANTTGMTITSGGRVLVEMKDTSVMPFDYLTLDMTATSASRNMLQAKVVKSDNRRVRVGSTYTFKPTSWGLSMTGPVSKQWCTLANHRQAKCGGYGN